jgi:hypothetical protein
MDLKLGILLYVKNINSGCRIWDSHSGGYEEYYLVGYNAV